ncbi:hypothetical protein BVC80_8919g15 [Macleaya cordata]|uniref:Protein kinase domain n=1 Tax=Macleaya cordata TaxID=56857 RepID=A0A200Q830_MACCD|nr:hypothetical protein BVC80_8919g15 [Macleaya cordata]
MVDPRIKGSLSSKSLSQFADIVSLCIQPEPEFRATMSEIVKALVHLIERSLEDVESVADGGGGDFVGGADDALEISFHTTYTGFVPSPGSTNQYIC